MGGIDGSAAAKACVVCIVSLCFLAQYCALLRICESGAYGLTVSMGECKVPCVAVGMSIDVDGAAWALGYAIVYSTICGFSFLGCAVIMCKADGWAKAYALGLVICMGILTLFDYWNLIAIYSNGKDNGFDDDIINYETFKIATVWFMELALYLNAAADAWFTNDEEMVDKSVLTR